VNKLKPFELTMYPRNRSALSTYDLRTNVKYLRKKTVVLQIICIFPEIP